MSLNLFLRAADDLRFEQDAARRGKAIRRLGRAALALTMTAVVNAAAQSVMDAVRDDDDEKGYWEKFAAAFIGLDGDEDTMKDRLLKVFFSGNAGSNLNPLGQIPYVKDLVSLAQGYSVARTDMEVISDIVRDAQLFLKSAEGGKKTRAYALSRLLASCAKLWGVPVSNLQRDTWALLRTAAQETGNTALEYEMEKAIYKLSNTGNKSRFIAYLYRARAAGDTETAEHIYKDLKEQMGLTDREISSAVDGKTRAERGVQSVDDLPAGDRYLAPAAEKQRQRIQAEVEQSRLWARATAQEQEKAEGDLYTLLTDSAAGEALREKAEAAARGGVSDAEYILFRLALSMADQPTESGKLGTITNAELEEAISMLEGLSRSERSHLWTAYGRSGKSDPWG